MRAAIYLLLTCLALPARAGSLDVWATDLAAKVAARGDVALKITGRDATLARLATELEGLALARLAGGARSAAVVGGAEDARRKGYDTFVTVEIALDGGEAVAAGRVISTERDLWRAAAGADPAGAVASSFIVRARLDGDLRAYLAPSNGSLPAVSPGRPRRMTFRPLKGGLDLDAPILALTAADLDGDGAADLVALTVDEVAVLRVHGEGVAVVARARLEGPAPVPRPRTPVGAVAVVEPGREIHARSSEHAGGAIWTLSGGALARAGEARDYPLCSGPATLVPGVSLFTRDSDRIVMAACGAGLTGVVDASGVLRLWRPGETKPAGTIPGVGSAFAIADLDGDGAPEVVSSAYRPPGARDALAISRLAADGNARPAGRATPVTGVAGIAIGDFDGDGVVDALAAVRAETPEARYEVWLLE